MGRPLRVECADGVFHVLSRGNERRGIFRDNDDRLRFLDADTSTTVAMARRRAEERLRTDRRLRAKLRTAGIVDC